MPACPAGHTSTATDYCDVCGLIIGAEDTGYSPASVLAGLSCPQCGAPALGRFCEVCGFSPDSQPVMRALAVEEAAPLPASELPVTSWTAVITASRSYYEAVLAGSGLDATEVPFPKTYPERRVPLTGSQLRIGRRSVSREVVPEIDLTGPPADPAISRLHAVLIAQPDGSWAVMDPGSENGTCLNGTDIALGDLVPLHSGDCICVGAWTAITIEGVT